MDRARSQSTVGLNSYIAIYMQNMLFDFMRRLLRVTVPFICAKWLFIFPRGLCIPNLTVSLTSYGERLESVHSAIYSIVRGKYLPQRIVLVVNEELSDKVLRRLQPFKVFGLEILRAENLGPHTKYFPVIQAGLTESAVLVTADDNIFYRRNWLQLLWETHLIHPTDVVCWWAKAICFDGNAISSYHEWPEVCNRDARRNHFALGVGGVLYPQSMISALAAAGDKFKNVSPRCDDVWLHYVAIESGHQVRQVKEKMEWPRHIPGTQDAGLKHVNHLPDGNDKSVRLTYSTHAIELIRQFAN